ncbi:MAG: peptide chain release factor-like protein [Candidatus Omnitrophica bacterium]|nr:peptide chain release factor-like protein [Candidatus Omnitrophota bacterium]
MNHLKYGVSQSKVKLLKTKMRQLKIHESDIIERFIRAAGPGGQKVNKTSSCVYLKHTPTKIEVKCQKERSQALNRFLARRILVDKIESLTLERKSEKQKQIEKIRRQKRKRSKRAKEKILKSKKIQSEKKKFRRLEPSAENE